MREHEIRSLLNNSAKRREQPDPEFVESLWAEIEPSMSSPVPVDLMTGDVDHDEHIVVELLPETDRRRSRIRGPWSAVAAAAVVVAVGIGAVLLQLGERELPVVDSEVLTVEQACDALAQDAPLMQRMLDGRVEFDGTLTAADLVRSADAVGHLALAVQRTALDEGELVTSLGLIRGALIQASVQVGIAPVSEVQVSLDYARAQLGDVRDAPALTGCFG